MASSSTQRGGLLSRAFALMSLALLGGLLVLNLRLHHAGDDAPSRPLAHLKALRGALEEGGGESMQALFPEGYFFTYALYGLSWVQIARRWPELEPQAISEARWALESIDSPAGREPFSADLRPRFGVFYAGWTAWLYAEWLSLSESGTNPGAESRLVILCDDIGRALAQDDTPFLASYPGQRWPTDTVVGVAALARHDELLTPKFGPTIKRWLQRARGAIAPETGLLPHRVSPFFQGARATSQTIIHRFLPTIDESWSTQQYRLYREHFVATAWPLIGVREYPRGVDGSGDVDSGPLVRGLSASASVVAMGAALQHGDHEVSSAFWGMTEALGMAWGGEERAYMFGLLPVSDAFVIWSQTAPAEDARGYPNVLGSWWRWSLHVLSLGLAMALGWLARRFWFRTR